MIRRRTAPPLSLATQRYTLTRTLTDISLSPTNSYDEKYQKRRSDQTWIVGFRLVTIIVMACCCWEILLQQYESRRILVIFDHGKGSNPVKLQLEQIMPIEDDDEVEGPDYGGLDIRFLSQRFFHRRIRPRDNFNEEHEELLDAMDAITHGGVPINTWEESSIDNPDPCIPPRWTFENHQACNIVHEIRDPNFKLLGRGYYRDAFLYEGKTESVVKDQDFVMKKLLLTRDLNQRQLFKVNYEALIMEKLASTGMVGFLYGHCGSTVLVERGHDLSRKISKEHERQNSIMQRGYFANEDLASLNEEYEGFFQNNDLSPEDKLRLALAMVKSVSLLHGYSEGVIAHDDISLDQWMLGVDQRVILNDFNSIRPLSIERTSGKYCVFHSRSGNYKAPEYFTSYQKYVTEASDIWPVGLVLYSLLTGTLYLLHAFLTQFLPCLRAHAVPFRPK